MKLLVVVAHPDDEAFGTGSVIARAAREGAEVVVCCATHGELGDARPGSVPEGLTLAEVRAGELRDAAAVLGACRVRLLDFEDSGWDGDCTQRSLSGARDERRGSACGPESTTNSSAHLGGGGRCCLR